MADIHRHGSFDEYREYIDSNADILASSVAGILWWKSCDLKYFGVTDEFADVSNLKNKNDIIDRQDQQLPWSEYACKFLEVNNRAINSKKQQTLILPNYKISNESIAVISTIKPVFNTSGQVMAIAGSTNFVNNKAIIESASKIEHFNYQNLREASKALTLVDFYLYKGQQLTHKESICLFFVLRGKTAKQISEIVCRSKRTIEIHMENIKNKFNVSSKSELIASAIEADLMHCIPIGVCLDKINSVI